MAFDVGRGRTPVVAVAFGVQARPQAALRYRAMPLESLASPSLPGTAGQVAQLWPVEQLSREPGSLLRAQAAAQKWTQDPQIIVCHHTEGSHRRQRRGEKVMSRPERRAGVVAVAFVGKPG